jgi:hypothetical protein
VVEIRSGGRRLSDTAWRVIEKKLADFSSVGRADPACSALGDTLDLIVYRGTQGHALTLIFAGDTATLAEPR